MLHRTGKSRHFKLSQSVRLIVLAKLHRGCSAAVPTTPLHCQYLTMHGTECQDIRLAGIAACTIPGFRVQ